MGHGPMDLFAVLDGTAILVAVAAALVFLARNQLRGEPRWAVAALAGIVCLGATVRLALSINAPMNAWSYERVLWLADVVARGPLFRLYAPPSGIAVVDLFSVTNLAVAMLTPLAYFVHARYLLADRNSALAAALGIATLPHHIRFSASDVQFIVSLLSSSLTFIAIYAGLMERRRAIAWTAIAAAPLLSWATYYTRPENIIFVAIDLAALGIYARIAVSRWRVVAIGGLVSAAGALSFVHHILPKFGNMLGSAGQLLTFQAAWGIGTSLTENTLINPSMMPTIVPVLGMIGLVSLVYTRQGLKAGFLVVWLGAFYFAESSVWPKSVAMIARYHLHLVTPFVMLAAAATPVLVRRRALVVLAGAWMLAAPLIHRGFIRDVAYSEMLEFAFLRRIEPRIETGCRVYEVRPTRSSPSPGAPAHAVSKIERLSARATERGISPRLRSTPLSAAVTDGDYVAERLAPPVREELTSGGGCAWVLLGLTCRAARDPDRDEEAPVCAELRALLTAHPTAQLVADEVATAQYYDDSNSSLIVMQPDGTTRVRRTVEDGDPLRFEAWRVR